MPQQMWTIHAGGQGSGPNSSDLVGCHLVAVEQDGDIQYQFEQPNTTWVASSPMNPTPPFQFPMFTSVLGGPPGSQAVPWYITVCSVSTGQATGTWSNTGYQPCPVKRDPADTWVAQAGANVDDPEAASADA